MLFIENYLKFFGRSFPHVCVTNEPVSVLISILKIRFDTYRVFFYYRVVQNIDSPVLNLTAPPSIVIFFFFSVRLSLRYKREKSQHRLICRLPIRKVFILPHRSWFVVCGWTKWRYGIIFATNESIHRYALCVCVWRTLPSWKTKVVNKYNIMKAIKCVSRRSYQKSRLSLIFLPTVVFDSFYQQNFTEKKRKLQNFIPARNRFGIYEFLWHKQN